MKYKITIDRLILNGIGDHSDRLSEIQEIVAAELGRMLSGYQQTAGDLSPMAVPQRFGGTIQINSNRSVTRQVGRQIARVVHEEIGHGAKNSKPNNE
jgi:hypothetical protein